MNEGPVPVVGPFSDLQHYKKNRCKAGKETCDRKIIRGFLGYEVICKLANGGGCYGEKQKNVIRLLHVTKIKQYKLIWQYFSIIPSLTEGGNIGNQPSVHLIHNTGIYGKSSRIDRTHERATL